MPFLSIIVPVFNAERYIRQCIESILNQSYLNYELILIDDGSTDSSGLICDEYLNRENVIVIHKKNAGHISARKDGVKYAKGKYIGFVDADDYVKRDQNFLCFHPPRTAGLPVFLLFAHDSPSLRNLRNYHILQFRHSLLL